MFVSNHITATTPITIDYMYKESVELIPVYLLEGCGMTYARINDTMPHTWIVWERYAECVGHPKKGGG